VTIPLSCQELGRELARDTGVEHAVLTSSATAAVRDFFAR